MYGWLGLHALLSILAVQAGFQCPEGTVRTDRWDAEELGGSILKLKSEKSTVEFRFRAGGAVAATLGPKGTTTRTATLMWKIHKDGSLMIMEERHVLFRLLKLCSGDGRLLVRSQRRTLAFSVEPNVAAAEPRQSSSE